jgi:hypothetical protein
MARQTPRNRITVDFLPASAVDAEIGIESDDHGCEVAYTDDVRNLRRFAEALIRDFHFGLRRRPVAYFWPTPNATASFTRIGAASGQKGTAYSRRFAGHIRC